MSRIYALLSVKFLGFKLWLCKKMTNIRYFHHPPFLHANFCILPNFYSTQPFYQSLLISIPMFQCFRQSHLDIAVIFSSISSRQSQNLSVNGAPTRGRKSWQIKMRSAFFFSAPILLKSHWLKI